MPSTRDDGYGVCGHPYSTRIVGHALTDSSLRAGEKGEVLANIRELCRVQPAPNLLGIPGMQLADTPAIAYAMQHSCANRRSQRNFFVVLMVSVAVALCSPEGLLGAWYAGNTISGPDAAPHDLLNSGSSTHLRNHGRPLDSPATANADFEFQVKRWVEFSGDPHLTIMTVGKTGVGKSTLINALVGTDVAETGYSEATTMTVKKHSNISINDIPVTIYDTPGLYDGHARNDVYLSSMKAVSHEVDLIIFCTPLSDPRFREEDGKTIEAIANSIPDFWQKAVVAFTFANTVVSNKKRSFKQVLNAKTAQWRTRIASVMLNNMYEKHLNDATLSAMSGISEVSEATSAEHVQADIRKKWQQAKKDDLTSIISDKIAFVPVGFLEDSEGQTLHDGTDWLPELWVSCFEAAHPRARPAMLQTSIKRMLGGFVDSSVADERIRLDNLHQAGIQAGKEVFIDLIFVLVLLWLFSLIIICYIRLYNFCTDGINVCIDFMARKFYFWLVRVN